MKKLLYVLMILTLLVGGNTQVIAQTSKASTSQVDKKKAAEKKKKEAEKAKAKAAKEKAKAKAAKEKAKAQAQKEKDKAKAAKEKERAAEEKAEDQAKREAVKAKELAAKEKEQAKKDAEAEKKREAYYKQQEELTNPKEKPTHYFNLSPRVGYSAMMDKNGLDANLSSMKNAKKPDYNRSVLGGVGAGLGLNYNLEYKHFLFETGLDFEYLSSASQYGYEVTRTDNRYPGAIYHYMADRTVEMRHLMNVGLPVMFGAEFNNFYFLLGARVGVDVFGTYAQKGLYDIVVTDPGLLAPYGLGIHDIPAPREKKLSWTMPDVKVCAELGLDLDEWLQKQPDKKKAKVKPGERIPFGREHVHYRVGLFAEYGVLNTNGNVASGTNAMPMNFAGNMYEAQSTNTMLALEGTKLNNLFVGAKFTIQFQVPGKTPAKVPAPPSFAKYVVVDQATGEPMPNATIETVNTKNNKVVLKERPVGKKNEILQKHPLGEYLAVAKAADYYDEMQSFEIASVDTTVELRFVMRHRPIFHVKVSNIETGEVLHANVQVRKRNSEFTPYTLQTDSAEGAASVMLADSIEYAVHIDLVGYEPYDGIVKELGEHMHVQMTPIKKGEVFIMKNMFFATNRTRILPTSEQSLQELFEYLERTPDIRIKIIGHTDNVGKDAANQKLSDGRANAVREDLIKRGIAAERIEAEGRGESQPIDTNDTEEGRQNNRRVEIEVL